MATVFLSVLLLVVAYAPWASGHAFNWQGCGDLVEVDDEADAAVLELNDLDELHSRLYQEQEAVRASAGILLSTAELEVLKVRVEDLATDALGVNTTTLVLWAAVNDSLADLSAHVGALEPQLKRAETVAKERSEEMERLRQEVGACATGGGAASMLETALNASRALDARLQEQESRVSAAEERGRAAETRLGTAQGEVSRLEEALRKEQKEAEDTRVALEALRSRVQSAEDALKEAQRSGGGGSVAPQCSATLLCSKFKSL